MTMQLNDRGDSIQMTAELIKEMRQCKVSTRKYSIPTRAFWLTLQCVGNLFEVNAHSDRSIAT